MLLSHVDALIRPSATVVLSQSLLRRCLDLNSRRSLWSRSAPSSQRPRSTRQQQQCDLPGRDFQAGQARVLSVSFPSRLAAGSRTPKKEGGKSTEKSDGDTVAIDEPDSSEKEKYRICRETLDWQFAVAPKGVSRFSFPEEPTPDPEPEIPTANNPEDANLNVNTQEGDNFTTDHQDELDPELHNFARSLTPHVPLTLASQEELEQELRTFARSPTANIPTTLALLNLIYERFPTPPTTAHYEALILANRDPEHGSLAAVRSLLAEMETTNVTIGATVYFAVLQVLTVHPDHQFRTETLARMQEQWIATDSAGPQHHTIAGLLRDGQLERAVALVMQLPSLHSDAVQLDLWVYVLVLHTLCAARDFGAVQQFLYLIEDHRVEIDLSPLSPLTWLLVLEAAARAGKAGTDVLRYVWRRQIETKYINPPTGLCWEVLLNASRDGNIGLAGSAVEILGRHEENGEAGLGEVVWEMLRAAYENAGDSNGGEHVRLRREAARERAERKDVYETIDMGEGEKYGEGGYGGKRSP